MPKQSFPAAAEGMPRESEIWLGLAEELRLLVIASDTLVEGRGFCRCAWYAATSIDDENVSDGMKTVLNSAETNIDMALAGLREAIARIKAKGCEA